MSEGTRPAGGGRWAAWGLAACGMIGWGGCGSSDPATTDPRLHVQTTAPSAAVAHAGTTPASTGPLASRPDATPLERGDNQAIQQELARLKAKSASSDRPVLFETEVAQLVAILNQLVVGFPHADEETRSAIVGLARDLLIRLGATDAPPDWASAIKPIGAVYHAGLVSPSRQVRYATVASTGLCWEWYPGRTPLPIEERILNDWKQTLYDQVIQCLKDEDPLVRVAAVATLSTLPIDSLAAPALELLGDPEIAVRCQVLLSFAQRESLLIPEQVLPLLHSDPEVAIQARRTLTQMGLSEAQIQLGGLAYHPQASQRLRGLDLVATGALGDSGDPEVWLLRFSRDPEAMVRLRVVELLSGPDPVVTWRPGSELARRLDEMAMIDPAREVRAAARDLVAARKTAATDEDATAWLPPLPGDRRFNPIAN
ncbi:HEAT domain containing protein [Isosphaera pallida ATCC 43644]|uniref:HEAT domain containing protein n=1 Tax=Isosphaera pallida (strain ATCC 43644 / DSM 9630 / IS1B) TaxID=575540 RepID=E8QXN3_ISOPI|nr:HEAT domain-containing protein [Isosphaera pallida]ADV64070.1 HEAT domain containing protein [Isosphaera pallida ATCC 43644]